MIRKLLEDNWEKAWEDEGRVRPNVILVSGKLFETLKSGAIVTFRGVPLIDSKNPELMAALWSREPAPEIPENEIWIVDMRYAGAKRRPENWIFKVVIR